MTANERVNGPPYSSQAEGRDAFVYRTRRMAKVWLHVALSVLAMNAAAVVNAAGDVRKCGPSQWCREFEGDSGDQAS